jgi:UTP-glucose-1-phosphate uridylyltransferase
VKPTLLVLAAGMGSRYGGLKQLDPVGPDGETMIDYSVHDAMRAGFGKLVFVIRRDFAELFKKDLGARYESHINVEYAYQELENLPEGFLVPAGREKPWGTGHAVLAAEGLIHEPFAMINADDFYGVEAYMLMGRRLAAFDQAQAASADYAMVGYQLKATLSEHGTVSRGICDIGADGRLKAVVEMKKIAKQGNGALDLETQTAFSAQELVSMNFWGFTPLIFSQLKELFVEFLKAENGDLKREFYVPVALDSLIKRKKASVEVLKSSGPWFGVTYRQDKPLVMEGIQRLIEAGIYPASLKKI